MLEFKQSDTAATLILTLSELVTIPSPFYLFVFLNTNGRETVTLILNSANDLSLFQNRYNSFIINPSVIFSGHQPGQWTYRVYQQVSSTNTDPTLSQGVIESGQMILDRAVDFAYSAYNTGTSYQVYGG